MRKELLSGLAITAMMASALSPIPTSSAQSSRVLNTSTTSQQSPTKNAPAPQDQQRRTAAVRRWNGGALTRRDLFGGGPGWTNKQVQRMAKKKRNVARSRKSAR